ncbi:MAG: cytochrome c biogenesis protein [Coriobacteriia bacterium]|nr:cytochrome c biogenesis protein [Coriobacteriia bacterium]
MEVASSVLFWFAFALYVGATVLYAYQFILKHSKVVWWARLLTGAGFLCHTASIGVASVAAGRTVFTGKNQLILASWALVLLYFVLEHLLKIRVYGTFLIPVGIVLMAISVLMRSSGGHTPEQELLISTAGIAFHVLLVVFANAGFAFGAVSSALYLYQNNQLKQHKSNRVSRRLPSLATLQTVARRSVLLAFPVYTSGLMLGVIRATQTDVGGWWADPRVMMSGFVWGTYVIYLVTLYRNSVSSRTSAWISVVGLVFVAVLAVLARTVGAGFHVFGVP